MNCGAAFHFGAGEGVAPYYSCAVRSKVKLGNFVVNLGIPCSELETTILPPNVDLDYSVTQCRRYNL